MPVTITYKKAPSNKTQTHPKIDIQGADKPIQIDQLQAEIHPLIDKLSIVLKPATEQDAYDIHSNIWVQFDDKSVFQGAEKSALKGYKRAYRIAINCSPSRPLFQYRYAGSKAEEIRLEFNPRKLGSQGLIELHGVLVSIIPDGWEYVVEHGRITRIDIMVDLPNTRMDSFVLLPKQGLTIMEWAVDGTLETFRLGKSKGNQTVIYNVKKKRQGQGKVWLGKSVVRVERRLRNPKPYKLGELPNFKNPFAGIALCENLPGPPSGKGYDWQWSMFSDSVKVRGLVSALALLPKDRRTKYRKHLEDHKLPWWDPPAIWAKWLQMLAQLNIASKKGWS